MGQPQAFIVRESTDNFMMRSRISSSKIWELKCWGYDYNGRTFKRVPVKFIFEEFKGTTSISSLRCYPLKFYRESTANDEVPKDQDSGQSTIEALKKDLVERGKMYRALCIKDRGQQLFDYDGLALSRGTGIRRVAKINQVRYHQYQLAIVNLYA